MIVLVMVFIIVSAVFSMFTFLVVINKRIEYRSNAYKLLDTKIEEARNENFLALVDKTETATNLPNGEVITDVNDNIEGFVQDDIKQVTVTVNWNFKGAQRATISSYVTRGGLQR